MKKHTIYIFLIATMVLQSCVTYQSTSVSINEAYNKGIVQVHTTSGEKIKFQNIEIQDFTYYGVTKNGSVKLDINNISAVYLEQVRDSEYISDKNSFMYIGPGGALGAFFLITQLKQQ